MTALDGIRILDLSRVLAGPSCTQVLGDLGADVIKVEKPGAGDDTRKWGPPFLKDGDGRDTTESGYYLAANRNKRSIAIDISKPEGQALVRRLAGRCDVLVENYKVGDLARYGLDWQQLRGEAPGLVYCSITGFGHTGPYAKRVGYDFLAQGMGGLMSLTGEPDGEPVKVGIANADLVTGMYAAVAILAALRHRDRTGEGQWIDLSLLDCQVAWLANEGENHLVSGMAPKRRGNAHANIVPYQVFAAADGHMILAVGNDGQFAKFCAVAGARALATDDRFHTNAARVANRNALIPELARMIAAQPRAWWLERLEAAGVPAGPVNTLPEAFADPQVQARGMQVALPHPATDTPVPLIASPLRLSATPPTYRHAPPTLGQHTDEVLAETLDLDATEIARLRDLGVL